MRLCVKQQPLAAGGCDTDYALRSSRGTQGRLNHRDARQQGRVQGPPQTNRVREGRRRCEAPPTDASHEPNRSLLVVVAYGFAFLWNLCGAEPSWSSCGKGSQTAWVGRKPGSRGSGLAAAGPRLVASLCPQRTIAAERPRRCVVRASHHRSPGEERPLTLLSLNVGVRHTL